MASLSNHEVRALCLPVRRTTPRPLRERVDRAQRETGEGYV